MEVRAVGKVEFVSFLIRCGSRNVVICAGHEDVLFNLICHLVPPPVLDVVQRSQELEMFTLRVCHRRRYPGADFDMVVFVVVSLGRCNTLNWNSH